MKRHCFTGKQRAFLWSGLALLALLLLRDVVEYSG